MPSLHVRPPLAPARAILAAAALVLGASTPLAAQAPVFGTDINVAGDTARLGTPLFFGTATVAPKGHFGIALLGHAAGDRSDVRVPTGAAELAERSWGAVLGATWGVTSRLTLGAQAGLGRTEERLNYTPPATPTSPQPYLGPSPWAGMDLRLHGRYLLTSATDEATRLAVNASISLPHTEWGFATLGLAAAQRLGRVTLHLAPQLRVRESARGTTVDAAGSGPISLPGRSPVELDVAGAATIALTRRVSWSVEAIGTNVTNGRRDPAILELGTGVRVDLGRALLDVGYREVGWGGDGTNAYARRRVVLGTHWRF